MASNILPERMINFRVYLDNKDCVGTAEVDLPTIEYLKDTVKGAGIAGELEDSIPGHFAPISMSLTWRVIEEAIGKLAACKAHTLALYASQQFHDAAEGKVVTQPIRIVAKTMPKSIGLGKAAVGATVGATTEYELTYLKVDVNKVERIEIDKLNFIARFDGVDELESVRADLGLK